MEWVLLLAVIVLFGARGFLPAWQHLNTDFPNYYLAAVLHHNGIPLDRAYEWIWFQRQKDKLGIDQSLVGYAPHPPICAVPFLPLARLPALQAKRVWLVLNLLFLVVAVWLLAQTTPIPFRRALLLAFLCVLPLRTNFLYGQLYVFLLFLISAAYYLRKRNYRFASGTLVAAAASLKIFPAGFLLLFLWKRDWRSTFGLLGGLALFITASVLEFGVSVHRVFIREVLNRASLGDIVNPYVARGLGSMWTHLFVFEPTLNPAPLMNSPFLAAAGRSVTVVALVVILLLAVRIHTDENLDIEWAGFLILLLLISSMPASYHYCLLIFSAIVGFSALQRFGRARLAILFAAFFALAFWPTAFVVLRISMVLASLAVLVCAAGFERMQPRTGLLLAAGSVILTCVLMVRGYSALRKQSEDYPHRMAYAGFSASQLTAVKDGLLFTDMYPNGYRASIHSGTKIAVLPIAGDALSVGGDPNSRNAYIEIAGSPSRIVKVDPPLYQPHVMFEGQQPSLSHNGKWLAFIREVKGRGVAWLVSTESGQPARMMTPPQLDVLELSVTDDGNLFAAIGPVGESRIASIPHEGTAPEVIQSISGSVRFPALSPDGRRLAFSRLRGGSWQLVVRDLADGHEVELTDRPCNSTTPAWKDDKDLWYATDCGRGLGLNAIGIMPIQ
jgi:hypothetical protein